jgi:low temperature requirement protein LtrA
VALYALTGRGNRELLGAVLRLAPWTLLGATLILVAGFTDGARTWLWLAALACTYVGAALSGSTGWQLHPSHLAERYGLVVIIALGEAFGIGARGTAIGPGEVVAAILGLLVATSLWLAYFDFFSIRADERLEAFDLGRDCVRRGDGARGAQHPTFIQTCAYTLYLVYILSMVYVKGYS